MLVQEPQSVSQSVRRRMTNLRFRDFLVVFYPRSSVFVGC